MRSRLVKYRLHIRFAVRRDAINCYLREEGLVIP